MSKIRLDADHTLVDGESLTFNAPCACNNVDGIIVYYPDKSGAETSKAFVFTDSHGNNLTGLGNLFDSGAYVKVILDTVKGRAFVQNADTNVYLENKIASSKINPNFLHNWYFKNAVNQRGKAEYTDVGYTFDRWKLTKASSATSFGLALADGCLQLTNKSSAGTVYCGQIFDEVLPPGTYTLTALVTEASGTGYLGFYQLNSMASVTYKTIKAPDLVTHTYNVTEADAIQRICFAAASESSIKVSAIKLERGGTQTLAHKEGDAWVLNEISDYNEELLKCIQSTADTSDTYANKIVLHTGNKSLITPEDIGAAPSDHTHSTNDVTGLSGALSGKANSSHTHKASDITDLLDNVGNLVNHNGSYVGTGSSGSNSPNTIVFPHPVLEVTIAPAQSMLGDDVLTGGSINCRRLSTEYEELDEYSFYAKLSSDKKTLTWYSGYSQKPAIRQRNALGVTYHYNALLEVKNK